MAIQIDQGTSTARSRMLATAIELFKQNGIQTTSVDDIVEECGSARGTLYSHFGSKSGLIAAVLEEEGRQWREWFFDGLNSAGGTPQQQLLRIFDLLDSWFKEEGYSGCLFMNAIAECRSQDEEVRQATLNHKKIVNGRIRQIAKAAGASDPTTLTRQLDLLLDGLIITALVTKSTRMVAPGKEAAKTLINNSVSC